MRSIQLWLATILVCHPLATKAAEEFGAESLDALTIAVSKAIDTEETEAFVKLFFPKTVNRKEHGLDGDWYRRQRTDAAELLKAWRTLLAERQQLATVQQIAAGAEFQRRMPNYVAKLGDNATMEYGYGTVFVAGQTVVVFDHAMLVKDRWYLAKFVPFKDDSPVNKLRGNFGSTTPRKMADDKTITPPKGWVFAEAGWAVPGLKVRYYDPAKKTIVSGEVLDAHTDPNANCSLAVIPENQKNDLLAVTVPATQAMFEVEQLKQVQSDPKSVTPSDRVLPGTQLRLGDKLIPVTADMPLVPGTPLVYGAKDGQWLTYIVLKPPGRNGVLVMDETWVQYPSRFPRELSQFAIEKTVAERLSQPNAEEAFAESYQKAYEEGLKKLIAEKGTSPRNKSELPPGYRVLEENDFVPKGTQLLVPAPIEGFRVAQTLLDSKAGPIAILWEDDQYEEAVQRSSLFLSLKAKKPAQPMPPAGRVELILNEPGKSRSRTAKVVMAVMGNDLRDALEIVDEVPISLRKTLSAEDAERFRKEFEAVGAKVTVRPAATEK